MFFEAEFQAKRCESTEQPFEALLGLFMNSYSRENKFSEVIENK